MECFICEEAISESRVYKNSLICNKCYNIKCNGENCYKKEIYFPEITEGTMIASNLKNSPIPLRHTEVRAHITGMISEVEVTQKFYNSFQKNIEALYVFPLPHDSAVNFLEIKVGDRIIKGNIKEKEEAKRTYEKAKYRGRKAGLLEEERPNLFTMSVANIEPKEEILVKLKYYGTLKYEDNKFEFLFPMTLTPRYCSSSVSDVERISPPVERPSVYNKREINIFITLKAGFEIEEIYSPSHLIYIEDKGSNRKEIQLSGEGKIPNKDFVLKYAPKGENIESSVSFYREKGKTGTFMLHITPKFDYGPKEMLKREIIFVLDRSGSMFGSPMIYARNSLKKALKTLRAGDTFNIITFDHEINLLSKISLELNEANLLLARNFIDNTHARGSTEILAALQVALQIPASKEHLRQIVFLTDGAVGNERFILERIEKNLGNARIFTFGLGSSVNRYIMAKMAEIGRGTYHIIMESKEIEEAMENFSKQTSSPVLSDITLEIEGAEVSDIYPAPVPDIYQGDTIFLVGRFHSSGKARAVIKSKTGTGEFIQELDINLPVEEKTNGVIETIWARKRIDSLMDKVRQNPKEKFSIRDEVIGLALKYRLLSPYTSFVAVEKDDEQENFLKEDLLTVNVSSLMPENSFAFAGEEAPETQGRKMSAVISRLSADSNDFDANISCIAEMSSNLSSYSPANYNNNRQSDLIRDLKENIFEGAAVAEHLFMPPPLFPELQPMVGKQMAIGSRNIEEEKRELEEFRKNYKPSLWKQIKFILGLGAAILFTIIITPPVIFFTIAGKNLKFFQRNV